MSLALHWDSVFKTTSDSSLGWYEEDFSPTLSLLKQLPTLQHKVVFIPGVGTSSLVEELLNKGSQVIINDISVEAINHVIDRLESQHKIISWHNQDISQPVAGITDGIDIWIDRAVLHFLLDEQQQLGYFNNLHAALKVGGYALFAEFSMNGATKCAGLPVNHYSIASLTACVGDNYEVMAHFDHEYFNPNGDPRSYLYVMYKRIK
jgi:hypothetical protein